VFIYSLLVVGCGTVPTRIPLPEELGDEAIIPGIPTARFWGDDSPPWAQAWFSKSEEEIKATYPGIYGQAHSVAKGAGQWRKVHREPR